jgi:general nucleoside transport system permease protein
MTMGGFDWVPLVLSVISASTPLLLAATGELVTEKSGVLNLGVEGMMLAGAVVGFAASVASGSGVVGIAAGGTAGALLALIFGVLTLTFLANQVATGLALTIFGVGFSALMGAGYVGIALAPLPKLDIAGLSDLPVVGPILFHQDILVYGSFALLAGVGWFLYRTHAGLVLRSIGDSHDAAHAIGYPVIAIRYAAVTFGGAMCGLAGAYMSLAYTPQWAENMTAGRGWIALALVVFATWRPARLLLGAYLFGGISLLQLFLQAEGVRIPSQFLTMLPYLATIVVLVLISRDRTRIRLNAPACLGKPFYAAG